MGLVYSWDRTGLLPDRRHEHERTSGPSCFHTLALTTISQRYQAPDGPAAFFPQSLSFQPFSARDSRVWPGPYLSLSLSRRRERGGKMRWRFGHGDQRTYALLPRILDGPFRDSLSALGIPSFQLLLVSLMPILKLQYCRLLCTMVFLRYIPGEHHAVCRILHLGGRWKQDEKRTQPGKAGRFD